MLSQNKIKLARALHLKKIREEQGLFIAEGVKVCNELLTSVVKVHSIYATAEWFKNNVEIKTGKIPTHEITEAELKKVSTLSTPNQILCIAQIPGIKTDKKLTGLVLVLDCIQDPGNFGTIIRIADWFGVSTIICSIDSVDAYNPKVVMASMGSLFRIKVFYTDLKEIMERNEKEFHLPVYGTFLSGENIYSTPLEKNAMIVLGNESKGIGKELIPFISHKISIPSFSDAEKKSAGAESLNVAVAGALTVAEFRRQNP